MTDYNLDLPLLNLSRKDAEPSAWTLRNAFEGLQIFGGIGSGKSTGSGRMIALQYLKAGFGGLVLTVKPTEKAEWEDYCKLTGRSDDLLVVEPGQENYFNFLDYESRGDGMTENIVQVLKTVIRAGADKSGGADDPFWENALDMLIFNVIDLCKLAYGKVSIQAMFDIVESIPKPDQQGDEDIITAYEAAFIAAKENVRVQVLAWEAKQDKTFLETLKTNAEHDTAVCAELGDARLLKFVDVFFGESFLHLSDKTRSIIDFSFSGFLFRLLREPVHSLFCQHPSTFTPEDCLNGKIILLNLPVKLFQKIGRDSQIMFKYIWQRAMEKRDVSLNGRPVFLWADEAQNFLHEHDPDYQATARSSRIATVYISQNLPNYHANMGGAKSEYRVKSFLGTLATKIFHANADVETNRYASELIGDVAYEETTRGNTMAGQLSITNSKSLKIDRAVRPEAFVALKTGGQQNNFVVEGYLHRQGSPIGEGKNYTRILFNQHYQ